jgi:RAP1 GTPase activating protein 1
LVDPAISKEILDYESRMCYNAFKFGVLYAGMGSTEDDFYSNTNPSQEFHNFLEFLGDMIRLQGWPHFTGGLDVNHNRTGRLSIYKRWASLEIMFHISTFLPYAVDDPQQIERKKHIGNDVVVIIFQDEGAPPFSPAMMKSYFNHVYVVIRPIHLSHDEVKYTLAVCSKNGVQEHTPFLPEPTLFDLNADFRRFLYTKLVNAERSSYEAPNFSKALCRTRLALLQEFSSVHSANTLNKKIRVKTHKQK